MTIPSNITLPLHSERILADDPKELDKYFRELIKSLQDMYSTLAQGLNGNMRTSFSAENRMYTPTLSGSLTPEDFTYTHQVGWVLRQGIIVDVWFDVLWSEVGTSAGNLILTLPYTVAVTNQRPFVGVLQPSAFAFTGGTECVITGISNTFNAEIMNTGDGFPTNNQLVVATGRLIGHLRYIGKENE